MKGRSQGKQVCLHTHINHANEITWVTRMAAQKLFEHGVIVRNQSVLLNGVNNNNAALSKLIKDLADINIQPVSKLVVFLDVVADHHSTTSINAIWFKVPRIYVHHSVRSSNLTRICEVLYLAS